MTVDRVDHVGRDRLQGPDARLAAARVVILAGQVPYPDPTVHMIVAREVHGRDPGHDLNPGLRPGLDQDHDLGPGPGLDHVPDPGRGLQGHATAGDFQGQKAVVLTIQEVVALIALVRTRKMMPARMAN